MLSTSRRGASKILIPILVVILIAVIIFLDMRRRAAEAKLKDLSIQLNAVGDQQNQERAKEIVNRVRKHMSIDTSIEPTVATIVDVKKLQAQNPFYDKAKNGDFLLITSNRAILYDANKDVIIDVVPVQLDQTAAQSSAKTSAKAGAATASKAAVKK